MRDYSRIHFGDSDLLRHADRMVGRGRLDTVEFLADLAEIDLRQLHRQAGHASLFAYCVDHHHLSEDETCRRVQAARTGRRFPVLFAELESGRLHLTAVTLLTPHLTPENADELIRACVHKSCRAIDQYLKQRFPEAPTRGPSARALRAIPSRAVGHAAPRMEAPASELLLESAANLSIPSASMGHAAPRIESVLPPALFVLRTEVDQETHEDLRAIQDLLGHAVPSGNMSLVVKRMARFYRAHLERKRFGSKAPRRARPSRNQRRVPAEMKRAVYERDGGRCTFAGTGGHRCATRKRLEFDHVIPVALGGKTTVDNLRMRCHAHNQLEAERVFGAEFMRRKRAEASARAP